MAPPRLRRARADRVLQPGEPLPAGVDPYFIIPTPFGAPLGDGDPGNPAEQAVFVWTRGDWVPGFLAMAQIPFHYAAMHRRQLERVRDANLRLGFAAKVSLNPLPFWWTLQGSVAVEDSPLQPEDWMAAEPTEEGLSLYLRAPAGALRVEIDHPLQPEAAQIAASQLAQRLWAWPNL